MWRIQALASAAVPLFLGACQGQAVIPVQTAQPSAPVSQTAGPVSPRGPALSPMARQVSQIAERNGDRNFLMIDKAQGEVIVFENGQATFSGAALTGENPADHMPEDAWDKPFSELRNVKYKITPAGRFTVSSGYDKAYGTTLDVNEVRGEDWDIAIHLVWLGAPAERRDERLRSPNGLDKHITYGCIDVDAMTMQELLRRVPRDNKTPIYILPADETLIMKFFQPRDAMQKPPSPSG